MLRPLLLASLVLASVPSTAAAAVPAPIDGNPLNIFPGDTGKLQARFDGRVEGEFFAPTSDEGSAGFVLGADLQGSPDFFGYGAFTPVSQQPVTGAGSATDPFRQVSVYKVAVGSQASEQPPGELTITQTITYVNGTQQFRIQYDLSANGRTPVTFRPMMGADLTPAGADLGSGFIFGGPPRVMGGQNGNSGGSVGIVEETGWRRFSADSLGNVNSGLSDLSGDGGLNNAVTQEFVDIATAVQWNDVVLCNCSGGQPTATYVAEWRFARFTPLAVEPAEAERAVGTEHTVTAKVQNSDGQAAVNVPVRFNVTGANAQEGAVNTGPDGSAAFTYTGREGGSDVIEVYADYDGDMVRDANEPTAEAGITWLEPVAGRTVTLEAVRGRVLVRLPRGVSAARFGLDARKAQRGGFVPLSQVSTIPVRSIVDVSRGEVRLTSAANLRGAVQAANFYSGRFQIQQRPTRRLITDIVMNGGSFRRCGTLAKRSSTGEPDATASQRRGRRVRRLWGNGRGRFRTRGRYSAATVRGTTWLVEDYCGGTLTRVARRPRTNRVDVRDFARKRTIRLKAGRSYFAPRRR